MAQNAKNGVFLSPLSLDDFKARYGAIGVFPVKDKEGKVHKFVMRETADHKAVDGIVLACVTTEPTFSYDKPLQIARILGTDEATGEQKESKILCNVGATPGDIIRSL